MPRPKPQFINDKQHVADAKGEPERQRDFGEFFFGHNKTAAVLKWESIIVFLYTALYNQ